MRCPHLTKAFLPGVLNATRLQKTYQYLVAVELAMRLHRQKLPAGRRMRYDSLCESFTGEAIQAGVPVAVCSTSNERAVSTIVRVLLGPEVESKMRVFAGDIVEKKKPSPDIYNLAAKELNVEASRSAKLSLKRHSHLCNICLEVERALHEAWRYRSASRGQACCPKNVSSGKLQNAEWDHEVVR